jgi:hypothetical protein
VRREEQLTREQYKKIRTNILWCIFYVAILSVLYLDLYVWRPN